MTARVLDGVRIGKEIRAEVAAAVARMAGTGRKPGLAVVIVGDDPASRVYVRSKGRACLEAGMHSETVEYPASVSQDELLAQIGEPLALCR